MRLVCYLCILCAAALSFTFKAASQRLPEDTDQLDLTAGYVDLDTPDFKLRLAKSSQTVAALEPKTANGFDFTPGDRLQRRVAKSYHHLGDLLLRIRIGSSGPWQEFDTAKVRVPVQPLESIGSN